VKVSKLELAQRVFSRDHLVGQGDLIVAAESEGRILGAVFLVNAESDLRQVASKDEAEFRILAVDRHNRRRGIARQLVQECLRRARCRGVRRMVLSSQPLQLSAHRLYLELGFRRQEERDWQTSSGKPRWVFSALFD
jgi:GNAT superfamily N-acetyltransferase